ncbi:MAG: hypothetical protein HY22_06515 [[Candidatus Thermochlorobacteriaceae] bacterium GBChlB]|nr:MAG: hypothetical protein HY22_06515 [[Candidatus Thermochlorobacteriaceae] bacterium GBChlB]
MTISYKRKVLCYLLLCFWISRATSQPVGDDSIIKQRNTLDEMLLKDSSQYSLYLVRAYLNEQLHDTAQAFADYTAAVRLAPDSAEGYIGRGRLRYSRQDYPRAHIDFIKALQIKPKQTDLYYYRGICRLKLTAYPEAIADFTEVIDADSVFATAYFYRAMCLTKLGQFEEALLDFNRAIEYNGAFAEAYVARGQLKLTRNMARKDNALLDIFAAFKLGNKDAGNLLTELNQQQETRLIMDSLRVYIVKETVVTADRPEVKKAVETSKMLMQRAKLNMMVVQKPAVAILPTFGAAVKPQMQINASFLELSPSNCSEAEVSTRRTSSLNMRCIALLLKQQALTIKDGMLLEIANRIEPLADDFAELYLGLKNSGASTNNEELAKLQLKIEQLFFEFQERLAEREQTASKK